MSIPVRSRASSVALAVVATLLLFSLALHAQEPPPPPGPAWVPPAVRARLSASGEFAAGATLWGPASSIRDAMYEAGFDDPGRGGVFGSQTVSYPRVHDFPERVSYWVGFRQGRRGGRWSVGLGAGLTGLGSAEGHRAGEFVVVKSSAFTFAPMLWLEAAPALRLGLGPAVHVVDLDPGWSDRPDGEPPEGENRIWRAGVLVEAAVTVPARGPFYVILLGQYRWLADATLDPRAADVPFNQPVRVPLSHAFAAVGVGFRF